MFAVCIEGVAKFVCATSELAALSAKNGGGTVRPAKEVLAHDQISDIRSTAESMGLIYWTFSLPKSGA